MQQTTNYGFKKPEYTDALDVNVIDEDMDIADSEIYKLTESLAIVQLTDTATRGIAKDLYVFWKTGLYISSADIEEGDTLSASNLTAVTGGGLNAGGAKVHWDVGKVQVYLYVNKKSTYNYNIYSTINNFLRQNNADFGCISGCHVVDDDSGYTRLVVENLEYVNSDSSLRVRNVSGSGYGGTIFVYFTYIKKG